MIALAQLDVNSCRSPVPKREVLYVSTCSLFSMPGRCDSTCVTSLSEHLPSKQVMVILCALPVLFPMCPGGFSLRDQLYVTGRPPVHKRSCSMCCSQFPMYGRRWWFLECEQLSSPRALLVKSVSPVRVLIARDPNGY